MYEYCFVVELHDADDVIVLSVCFQWQVDNDMHSTCFICSRNSYDFEHGGGVSR